MILELESECLEECSTISTYIGSYKHQVDK